MKFRGWAPQAKVSTTRNASAAAGTDRGRGGRVGLAGVCVAVWGVGAAKGLLARIGGDELSQAIDGDGASGGGEEAVVADAMEAARQHVQEEAADELGRLERHRFDPGFAGCAAAGAIVLPTEGDALVVEPDQTRVRDGDAMGVAREIGENRSRSGERPPGVDDPFGAVQRRERCAEGVRVGERGEVAEESATASEKTRLAESFNLSAEASLALKPEQP